LKNALALLLLLAVTAHGSRIIVDCPTVTTISNTTVSAKFYNDSTPACGLECNATLDQTTAECVLLSCAGYVHTFAVNTTLAGNYSLLFFNSSTNASCQFVKPVSQRQPTPDLSPVMVGAAALAALLSLRRLKQRY